MPEYVACQDRAISSRNCGADCSREYRCAKRDVPSSQSLRHCGDVRFHVLVVKCSPGATTPAHTSLVRDQENIVAIADGSHRFGISGRCRNNATGGTHDWLENESGHPLGADALNALLELGREGGDQLRWRNPPTGR